MSDPKRPGGKSGDISELKQRLGLKKGAQPTTGQVARTNGAPSGGVVPPPGLNLPPPPGIAPPPGMAVAPTPSAPPPPNAHEDPFGAMSHMANAGAVARAPEYIVVNDGKPVEGVGSSSTGAKVAMIAIPGVVALVLGMILGSAGRGGRINNEAIDSAKQILTDEGAFKQDLLKAQQLIPTQATKQGSKIALHPDIKPDRARDAQLAKLAAALEIKPNQYTIVRNITSNGDTAHELMAFYEGVEEVRALINQHTTIATFDDQAYLADQAAAANTLKDTENALYAGQVRYAVVGSADESSPSVRIVELGPPFCGGRLATNGKCAEGEAVTGVAFRPDPSAPWQAGDIAPTVAQLTTKKIAPIAPDGTLDALMKSSPTSASEILYARRLQHIYDRADQLIQDANKLEGNLTKISSAGHSFTFFM